MQALRWRGGKQLPLVRQTEMAECGLACLTMIANWHGRKTDLPTLRERFAISQYGMTLQHLIECAETLRFATRALRLEPEDLKSLRLPSILHWDMNHFVVLHQVRGKRVIIHDPERGRVTLSLRELGQHFTGIALELTPTSDFIPRDERKKIALRQLIGKTPGLVPAMLRILIFALALELLALGSPLLNQLVIDDVLVAADQNLLTVVIIAMILLTLTQMLISLACQWASITLAVNFNMQWTARVFHHLLRLPLAWFDARSKGSISARFDATASVQTALTTQLLSAILDLLLVIMSLGMMLLYSPGMTLIAVVAAILYGVLRALWYPSLRRATEDAWDAEARESSHFLETLGGILSLRINGVIAMREAAWSNLNVMRRNAHLRQNRLQMYYEIAHTLTGSLVSALVLWKGATEVLNGTFTVGMLVAYLSYQGRFSTSISGLTDCYFAWKMLDIYNVRLADIVLTPVEGQPTSVDNEDTASRLAPVTSPPARVMTDALPLSVERLSFRHKGEKTSLLRNVSLTLHPGEVLAITGKSGCGKSTLLKIILGIHSPEHGALHTFGIAHHHPDYVKVRRHIGTVLQEDQLFRGSVADNIMFFQEERDPEWMATCARLARIDNDIMAMTGGYQTLLGESGNGLSGGQKQRLLLARALYKRPGFLLLDEATSHLDIDNEMALSRMLRDCGLPVLLIAHRPETLRSADRVLIMENGELHAL